MTISFIIRVEEDIVKLYNDKNVELFGKNLTNVFLKAFQYSHQPKKYHLVFEVTISSLEYSLLFILFANSYVYTGKAKLDEPPSST